MSEEIKWIFIYGSILFLLLMTIALCSMAGKWDDVEERNQEKKKTRTQSNYQTQQSTHKAAHGSSQREGDNRETQDCNRTRIKRHREIRCNRKTTSK